MCAGPQKSQPSVGGGEQARQTSARGEGAGDEDDAAHAASTLAYSMQGKCGCANVNMYNQGKKVLEGRGEGDEDDAAHAASTLAYSMHGRRDSHSVNLCMHILHINILQE